MRRPVLGILGGVGPMATAYFMELLMRRTPASRDQDHMPMIVINDPQIPDRTAHILDHACPDPQPEMVRVAQMLEEAGADYMAIPCNTAHYYYEAVAASVHIPVLNIMTETVSAVSKLHETGSKVGLMATEGTVASGVFQARLDEAGLVTVTPDTHDQHLLNQLIYGGVKAGRPYEPDDLLAVANRLRAQGCGAVISGCTELSVITGLLHERPSWLLDSLEVLTDRCVEHYLHARQARRSQGEDCRK